MVIRPGFFGDHFQQRHLLCHREGMVDQRYIDNSGDSSYLVGQRLVVGVKDAGELTRLVQFVVEGIWVEMVELGLLSISGRCIA